MKKGCLIVGVATLLLVIGVGTIWALRMNRQFGLFEAGAISHDKYADARTRLRAVIDGSQVEDLIVRHLPKGIPLPAWLPVRLETLVKKSLPREVALLEQSDYAKGEVTLTLFINERRGGPFLAEAASALEPPPELNQLEWERPVLKMPERGVLEAVARLPIPDGLESRLLEDWTHDSEGESLKVEGGHLAELVLDNRNGEAFTLAGALMQASGEDWRARFDEQGAVLAMSVLPMIHDVRLYADLTAQDTLRIHVRANADPNAATALNLFAGYTLPAMKQEAANQGMKLEGEAMWNDAEQALIGDLTLTGFEALIDRQVQSMFPAPAPAA